MTIIPQKCCTRCGVEKPLTEFHRSSKALDGRKPHCKACVLMYMKSYHQQHAERERQRAREWSLKNPELVKQRSADYRRRKKETRSPISAPVDGEKRCYVCEEMKHVSEFHRNAYRSDGLQPRCKECSNRQTMEYHRRIGWKKRYYHEHREYFQKKAKEAREKHPERERMYRHRWEAKNPGKRQECVMRRNARKKQATIGYVSYKKIWERDQGMCYICGQIVEWKDRHFDHIIPLSKGGKHSMGNIAVTHARCNQQKGDRLIRFEQQRMF